MNDLKYESMIKVLSLASEYQKHIEAGVPQNTTIIWDLESCSSLFKEIMGFLNKNFKLATAKSLPAISSLLKMCIGVTAEGAPNNISEREVVINGEPQLIALIANVPNAIWGNMINAYTIEILNPNAMEIVEPVPKRDRQQIRIGKYYRFNDMRSKEAIEQIMVAKTYERNDLLPGIALYMMAVEQFNACSDSSGMTIKVRRDGTRAKRVKDNRDTLYTSESCLTAHMAGYSLPGRLQKALRVDVGIGLSIEEALTSSVRLGTIPGTRKLSEEELRIARQSLNTALNFCQAKLHPIQFSILKDLENIGSTARAKASICSIVASSLDAIRPYVNKPILIHPCIALNNKEALVKNLTEHRSVYKLGILDGINISVKYTMLPGFKSQDSVTQALAMTCINNVYGSLSAVNEMFTFHSGFNLMQRSAAISELKQKYTGVSREFTLKKAAIEWVLSNFSRGIGTESQHQATIHNSFKNSNERFCPYVHRVSVTRGGTLGSAAARNKLAISCRNARELEQFENEWKARNNGTDLVLNVKDGNVGYFNVVQEQTERDRIDIIGQWKEASMLLRNSGFEEEEDF